MFMSLAKVLRRFRVRDLSDCGSQRMKRPVDIESRSIIDGSVEPLESRLLLAGNVTAVLTNAGTLRITGTNEANQVLVTADGFGNISVEGKAGTGTTINGAGQQFFSTGSFHAVPQDLVINLKGADDFLEIDGIAVLRNLRVITGSGDDTVGVFGALVQRDANFNLGSDNDLLGFSDVQMSGKLRVQGGSGDDMLGLAHCVSVMGTSSVNMGSGDDVALVQGFFLKTLNVSMGAGTDAVRVNRMDYVGKVRFSLGGGDDDVVIGGLVNQDSGASMQIIGGGGYEFVILSVNLAHLPTTSSVEATISTSGADSIVDDSILAIGIEYVLRGGDPLDLPC